MLKTIVVTGALGVLGRAVVQAAAGQGWNPVGIDVAPAPAEGGDPAMFYGVDLTDLSAAETAMKAISVRAGSLDALINVAGGFRWQTLADGDLEGWDALYRMNVRVTATACKAAMPYLREIGSGAIVNVGANGAMKAAAGMGAYAASKAGVHRLTESLAEELKGVVRVNAVLPSIIDTPANRKDMPGVDPGAWVSPHDLAEVILFLASDKARSVTGALLPVTGLC